MDQFAWREQPTATANPVDVAAAPQARANLAAQPSSNVPSVPASAPAPAPAHPPFTSEISENVRCIWLAIWQHTVSIMK